jgi:HPt (histidine-containing phosphotransfer) domain-containing protein
MDAIRISTDGMIARLTELLVDTDPEFLLTLIDLFRNQGEEMFGAVQRAADARELKTLERSAHSLKGAATNIGATDLKEISQVVEHGAKRGEILQEDIRHLGEALAATSAMLLEIRGRIELAGEI